MEYASLIQQWKAACALDKLANKKPGEEGSDGTDGNGNGVPDALEGTGEVGGVGDGDGDVQGAKRFGIGVSTSLLSQDNIFGSGSCPQPPTFKYMGATVSGSDFPYWCQAMAILRGLILIFGAFTALKILMGWGF
ncbi:virulence factor TspB C-terminal domain-related protein [Stenotrophomonas humi]|uniref:virulence factor TspB C-terminal domain-related protein n=1 Tax=Stenotrophomonas humi TaxID=405444 RepID=UPI000B1EA09E|nr:virulence factor TspB C-terminal domain-related protein [Stenotrophomonas humi]